MPHGSDLCATPSVRGRRRLPQAVRLPYRPGPYQVARRYRISATSARPRLRADDAVDGEAGLALEALHRGVGGVVEDPGRLQGAVVAGRRIACNVRDIGTRAARAQDALAELGLGGRAAAGAARRGGAGPARRRFAARGRRREQDQEDARARTPTRPPCPGGSGTSGCSRLGAGAAAARRRSSAVGTRSSLSVAYGVS